MIATFVNCPDCGSEHIGPHCGLSFRDRLASVRLDPGALETRRRNYVDMEPIHNVFGADAAERMRDDTEGYGATRTDPRTGEEMYRDRKSGDWERVPDDVMDRVYLGGSTEREVG